MKYPYIGKFDNCVTLFTKPKTGMVISHPQLPADGVEDGDWSELKFKNITREYLEGKCVKIESPEHSEFVQKLAFNAGYLWLGRDEVIDRDNEINVLYFRREYLTWDKEADFKNENHEQITIPLPPKAEHEAKRYKFKEGEIPSAPKHFDCVCVKCGGKCCIGNCEPKELKTFAGVATIGNGKYRSRNGAGKIKAYKVWEGMITRCYVKDSAHYSRYGGRGVKVCDLWLNFQNFAEWYFNQKHHNEKGLQIDKDLTVVTSKLYSPENCSLVPARVNSLLISTNSKRGDLPVGVHRLKDKFKSSCRNEFGSKVHLGTFKTPDEAFGAYKNFKKGVVLTVANDEYRKGNISDAIYKNLINIELEPFPT